jgi:hypothetical protein
MKHSHGSRVSVVARVLGRRPAFDSRRWQRLLRRILIVSENHPTYEMDPGALSTEVQ